MPHFREERPGAGLSSQEQSDIHYETHEELVEGFRSYVKAEQHAYRNNLKWDMSPEEIIQISLYRKYKEGLNETPRNRTKENFFQTLQYAWDILVYDRLDRHLQYGANNSIAEAYNKHPVLRLNPTQVRILDAAAEAIGIQHQKGQSEISVPQKHYYWPLGHNGPGAM